PQGAWRAQWPCRAVPWIISAWNGCLEGSGMQEASHALARISAFSSAVSTILIQRCLRRSNFYAGFWINVAVGVVGLWTAVLLFVPREAWDWRGRRVFSVSL